MLVTNKEAYPLFRRIDALRLRALEDKSLGHLDKLNAAIADLDEVLKREMQRIHGNENLRRHVPEWHKLVGSTPEIHEVPDEAKDAIVRKIECLVEAFELEWGL